MHHCTIRRICQKATRAVVLFAAATSSLLPTAARAEGAAPPVSDPRCPDLPNGLGLFEQRVEEAFWRDGEELKRLAEAWKDPSCVFNDGRPMMMALLEGYNRAFRGEQDWGRSRARIEELKK